MATTARREEEVEITKTFQDETRNAINENAARVRREKLEGVQQEELDELVDDVEVVEEEEEEEAPLPEAAEENIKENKQAADSAEEELVEIKVFGKTQKVPKSKILDAGLRTFQKETAADQKLKELSAMERELREKEKWLQNRYSHPPQQSNVDDDELYRKAVNTLYESGDEAEAAKALKELIQTESKRNVPTSDLLKQVMIQTAKEEFGERFPEVATNPQLYNLADRETIRLQQEYPHWSPRKIILEAGRIVDGKRRAEEEAAIQKQQQSTQPIQEDTLETKRELKRATTQPSKASGRVPGKPVQKVLTRSDVVAQMRKNRVSHNTY